MTTTGIPNNANTIDDAGPARYRTPAATPRCAAKPAHRNGHDRPQPAPQSSDRAAGRILEVPVAGTR
jgi:hypothetical protein